MKINNWVKNTKTLLPEYWENTLKQRLMNGAGSGYSQFKSIEELEEAILNADWIETTHPDVMKGCRVFKTNLPGIYGLVEIETLPENVTLRADDRKNTGKVSMTVEGTKGETVDTSYLIIGEEQGVDVIFTFHPGEPIAPSVIEVNSIAHKSLITKQKALELGFKYAKIV